MGSIPFIRTTESTARCAVLFVIIKRGGNEKSGFTLCVLNELFGIVRMTPKSDATKWVVNDVFYSVTSTDTDHILVRETDIDKATTALKENGCLFSI